MKTLKAKRAWVTWRLTPKGKVPYSVYSAKPARCDDRFTWGKYSEAVQRNSKPHADGIGFMLYKGLAGIDIDSHADPALVQEVKALFYKTYQEVSPSGEGVHIIFNVNLSELPCEYENGRYKLAKRYYKKNPHNGLEAYCGGDTNRFFTYTGNMISRSDRIVDCTEEYIIFLNKYMLRSDFVKPPLPPAPPLVPAAPVTSSASAVSTANAFDLEKCLARARKAKNGYVFMSLYDRGDISAYNGDDSAADLALCCLLAFYLQGDKQAIDTAFRGSALYRDKWERADYRESTIDNAVNRCNGVFYRGPGRPKKKVEDVKSVENAQAVKLGVSSISDASSTSNTSDSVEVLMRRVYTFNVELAKEVLNRLGVDVRYNVITQDIDFILLPNCTVYSQPPDWKDLVLMVYSVIPVWYPGWKGAHKSIIEEFIEVIAKRNPYNPVLDLFAKNKWDGQDHLQKLYNALHITDDLSKALIKKWFWQGHALLRNDGSVHTQGVLVLQGKQGVGKTTLFSKFALTNYNHSWYGEGGKVKDFDKDFARRVVNHFVSELGELNTTLKSDIDSLKSFISNSIDKYRLPYDRKDTVHPRHTSLCATVNDSAFLIDPTGNRRFWTIPKVTMDFEAVNAIDYLQVWLQVWEQYAKDDLLGFRLTDEESAALSARNSEHNKTLKGEDEVLDILSKDNVEFKLMTVSDFKTFWPSLSHYNARQIGVVLDKLGIERCPQTVGGKWGRYRYLPCPVTEHTGRTVQPYPKSKSQVVPLSLPKQKPQVKPEPKLQTVSSSLFSSHRKVLKHKGKFLVFKSKLKDIHSMQLVQSNVQSKV